MLVGGILACSCCPGRRIGPFWQPLSVICVSPKVARRIPSRSDCQITVVRNLTHHFRVRPHYHHVRHLTLIGSYLEVLRRLACYIVMSSCDLQYSPRHLFIASHIKWIIRLEAPFLWHGQPKNIIPTITMNNKPVVDCVDILFFTPDAVDVYRHPFDSLCMSSI